jgi:hypothetical protein
MKPLCFVFVVTCFAFSFSRAAEPQSGLDSASKDQLFALTELFNLQGKVAALKCPVHFADAFKRLDGKATLSWIYGTYHADRSRQIFSIVTAHLKGKGYVVVFEGTNIINGDSVITRVAVGFPTPLGPTYYAERNDASKILIPDIGNGANQLPDPTSPSVTPPAKAGGAPSVTADH